jgi:selenocysteine lyase/cysteine desulfurase
MPLRNHTFPSRSKPFSRVEASCDWYYAGQRYERVGQKNIPSLLAIGAALDLQAAIGPQNIVQRIRELAAQLRAGLRSIPEIRLWTADDPALTAGLTTFTTGDLPPGDFVTALREKYQIAIRPINHADVNAARASTHYFNSPEEVDLLISAARSLISRRTLV